MVLKIRMKLSCCDKQVKVTFKPSDTLSQQLGCQNRLRDSRHACRATCYLRACAADK